MKKIVLITLALLSGLTILAQSHTYIDGRGNQHLLGTAKVSDFKKEPFKEWFDKVYSDYTVNKEILEKVDAHYDPEIEIKVFLGTWCGDSKRQVSRFAKLIDHSKIDFSNTEFICLDNREGKTKQGPNREESGMNIHRVPTFIFYKNDEEIARIVEEPVNSLEKDIAQIYAGLPTRPNYIAANYVSTILSKHSIEESDSLFTTHLRYLSRVAKHEGELNTLGYVLLAAEKYPEALSVFKLNTKIYPESSNVHDSLGEAFMITSNKEEAIKCYLQSYHLDPENENAVEMVTKMMQ